MYIAVASRDGKKVSGHIGKCAHWILYEVKEEAGQPPQVIEQESLLLAKPLIFHYYKDDQPHPLRHCTAVIGASAGESFVEKMKKRGIATLLTAETDPAKAVEDFVNQQLTPPKPRPIGSLVCKVRDWMSSSHD
ncbi:NifB/NifX family molybdenum-iron cluster-binding protein [Marinospirillum perlucidum]|uniref:NifB/NifX family molybdenum-iron cluster-binding protein n=1 Tax=Marinospirillum perlucidum TaxID=1982602 RepID=UPI000DF1982B|nr:NifB/NifX family molybdenum-iron cluster-binding protein [Marinospirillum perlucidum]